MRGIKEIEDALAVQEENAKTALRKANGSTSANERDMFMRQRNKSQEKALLLKWVLNEK